MQRTKNISCIIVDDEIIAREIIATHLSKINNITIVASCSKTMDAFDVINNNKIDLVFLDINMPEVSGISFAKSINRDIKIIFTTAYRDYAVEGFELQAVDYLLKPISFERLLKAVNTYFEVYSKPQTNPPLRSDVTTFMFVRSERRMIKIDFHSIVYIESYSDYLKIHLANDTIVTRETITAIEAKLPRNQFIRIHRSFIVATANISAFTNEHVVVNDKALTISRSYKKDVLRQLEHY
ncbi:LytTR family two component transcriptional regulator [Gelidibacter algens]|uniref:LytTR family two component transcriptional regulator n=1 Tax=Gelidibacter algens TaxID=49280 RepID=A0A327S8Y9_9FLAO|nr:LytTR family DNA-binding domain-containing protein [Gelidibacter algens]RAJ24802.1 LytTR family two component transcriptional regulator [Gelidibacter algens]